MQRECEVAVLEAKCFEDLQERCLADPKSGPRPFLKPGDEFALRRTPERDDLYHLMDERLCGEAWDAVSRHVHAALRGGSIMRSRTSGDRMTIACRNDGTRPVISRIERIDIPENDEGAEWLARQDFANPVGNAYAGQRPNHTSRGHNRTGADPSPMGRQGLRRGESGL